MSLKKLVISSFLLVSALFADNYNIDKSNTNIGFSVTNMMVRTVSGNFNEFNGTFEYDETTKTLNKLNGEIEVSSVNTENKKRDDHLRSDDFFDVKKFPKIIFILEKVENDIAYGKFTIKDVTKDIKLDFNNDGMMKDSSGNERIKFALSGEIKRTDYGITWNKMIEAGGVAVSDTVKLNIQIEGIKKI